MTETKNRVGDREAGAIVGKGRGGALVAPVDQASKFALPWRDGRKTADAVGAVLLGMLLPFAALVRTFTADNGKEFAGTSAWRMRSAA